MAVTGKIDRKYMAHYIDAGSLCGGLTPKYERLGKDLEEYNVELKLTFHGWMQTWSEFFNGWKCDYW